MRIFQRPDEHGHRKPRPLAELTRIAPESIANPGSSGDYWGDTGAREVGPIPAASKLRGSSETDRSKTASKPSRSQQITEQFHDRKFRDVLAYQIPLYCLPMLLPPLATDA